MCVGVLIVQLPETIFPCDRARAADKNIWGVYIHPCPIEPRPLLLQPEEVVRNEVAIERRMMTKIEWSVDKWTDFNTALRLARIS